MEVFHRHCVLHRYSSRQGNHISEPFVSINAVAARSTTIYYLRAVFVVADDCCTRLTLRPLAIVWIDVCMCVYKH